MKDSNGDTPLHEACHHGEKEIVSELLLSKIKKSAKLGPEGREKQINLMSLINCKNHLGLTPFHLACRGGHLEIAQELHNDSDKPEELVTEKDTEGATALHLACQKDQPGNVDVVKFLLSKGAVVLAKNNDGTTPVHTAAEHGCVEVMKSIFEYDEYININVGDRYKQTPLHFAAEHGKVEMIQLLLDK
jgi:ankyrin repeat protein